MNASAENKVIVGFSRNYSYPDLLRQTQDGKGKWNDIQFVDLSVSDIDMVDVLLVLNHPNEKINIKVKKGGKVILIQEPPYPINDYLHLVMRHMDLAISGFKNFDACTNLDLPAGLPWHINKTYSELSTYTGSQDKLDEVSWITSSNNMFPGHKTRLEFMSYLNDSQFKFNLFGRGFNPIDDKFDGIAPYKYSLAAENYVARDYYTEKVVDVFLSGSMPIYYGCENLDKYFPKESFIKINMMRPEESLDKIKMAMADNLFDKNKEYIEEAKELILNKYQLFPLVESLITTQLDLKPSLVKVEIRPDGLSAIELIKKKIKSVKRK